MECANDEGSGASDGGPGVGELEKAAAVPDEGSGRTVAGGKRLGGE